MSKRRDWVLPTVSVATIVLAVAVALVYWRAQTVPTGHGTLAPGQSLTPSPTTPYICWSGTGASSLADCSDPEGATGLSWVFPDRHRVASCTTQDSGPRDLLEECSFTWRGEQVYLRYGFHGRWTDGQATFEASGVTPQVTQRSDGSIQLYWRPRKEHFDEGGVSWRTAQMIRGKGWTFAAYAPTQAVAQAALEEFGTIRDLRQWRGLPR
ncbi:MAG: hypothetical protein J2O46_10255 [Nocardioides sp.]|nr:hypothetical protein [Nocardioides sp.]